MAFRGDAKKMDFIDRLASWMEGCSTKGLFSEEEQQILETIEEFEDIRKRGRIAENCLGGGRDVNTVFRALEREKEISFRLKSLLFAHMDRLIADGSIEGWVETMAWYHLVDGKELMGQFWEFYILKILLGIYAEEWKGFSKSGRPICILQFRSIGELLDGYFQVLFLLRRLEYGIEPLYEIVEYVRERGISLAYIDKVADNSQIEEKEMVKAMARELCGSYGIGWE